MAPGGSTVPETDGLDASRRGRILRRVFVVLVVAVLACAMGGLLGVRTTTKSLSGGGYQLQLRYAKIVRPGLAVPWQLTITKPGGFGDSVKVSTKSSYLDIYDENGLDPDPSSATQDGDRVIWEFDPPPGDTLTVSFDWRIEPGVQLENAKGETSVLDDDDKAVATIRYSTWVMP